MVIRRRHFVFLPQKRFGYRGEGTRGVGALETCPKSSDLYTEYKGDKGCTIPRNLQLSRSVSSFLDDFIVYFNVAKVT